MLFPSTQSPFVRVKLQRRRSYSSDSASSSDSTMDELPKTWHSQMPSDLSHKKRKVSAPTAPIAPNRVLMDDGTKQTDETSELASVGNHSVPRKRARPMIPLHQEIAWMISTIKNDVHDIIAIVSTLKVWIQLNIPRIEDGNNFGVGIQEEVVGELTRAEDNAYAILESITKYYLSRGKIISKVVKYPEIADFRQCVVSLDEKELKALHLCRVDIRNGYALILDIITKNHQKLCKPRSSDAMSTMF
eukprot:c4414_g1_i2.p1 GENE.c4414_g1_i2~~c4414_g1_i2.p1  ORF type:complete len:246 (+),score=44.92 c4414_g1_i2:262-999(+)